MINRLSKSIYARYRGFAPLSCRESYHADELRGFRKWRWLSAARSSGRMLDPQIMIRHSGVLSEQLELGDKAQIDRGAICWMGNECGAEGRIHLQDNCYIGPYVFLGSCHNLSIGPNSMIGGYSYLTTVNHVTQRKDICYSKQGYRGGDILIGENVWLGCHVTVLPDVKIGRNAIIGAGAVVNKDVPEGETWAGVPAKKIA